MAFQIIKLIVERNLHREAPATGLGLFRIAFGLVALQEVLFLFYFRHLIFDVVPFIDRASPILHFFLLVWAFVLLCLIFGYFTRRAALVNYVFWVVFVVFTPMWQDFDGGFDQLMTSSSFLLIFLPSERAFSLDNLRWAWKYSSATSLIRAPRKVTILAYLLPLGISLGLLYLDSGIHKLSSEFWRNGMGSWLPATMPYYASPLDVSPILNQKGFETLIGLTIVGFQFLFIFLYWHKWFRVPILLVGAAFHIGIILCLNIYPFGFAMLVHYLLLIPFHWWRRIRDFLRISSPSLTVFFDQECPLCNRTVLLIEHFDIANTLAFKSLQEHARSYRSLDKIPNETLLKDLYAIDKLGNLYSGFDTYLKIMVHMRYLAPLGCLMGLPGLYQLGTLAYRKVADNRVRSNCNDTCSIETSHEFIDERPFPGFFSKFAHTDKQITTRISKALVIALVLQINCTLHYGVFYRWMDGVSKDPALIAVDQASDSLINFSHAFFGISPHALYLHDHFDNYNTIVAITYLNKDGTETWLPFINEEGRLLSPNWGRVQSMWANVAITSHMSRNRLEKFIKKITAYYGPQMTSDFSTSDFILKVKNIDVPTQWVDDLRHKNMTQPWRNAGYINWRGETMSLTISEADLTKDNDKLRPELDQKQTRGTIDLKR